MKSKWYWPSYESFEFLTKLRLPEHSQKTKNNCGLKINWSFDKGCLNVSGSSKWGDKNADLLSGVGGRNAVTPFKILEMIPLLKGVK